MSSTTIMLLIPIALLVGISVGYLYSRMASTAGTESLYAELTKKVAEARDRENESKNRISELDAKLAELNAKFNTAMEEKGRFQAEAARVEEARATLKERESQIEAMNARIAALEVEKSQAVKDAEGASQRATEMIAKEREQIAEMSKFVEAAHEALKNEFKALSTDTLKDVSEQLLKTADTLIEKHGEKTTSDVRLHHQQIETMLKPVEETIKRLDKHVEESDLARTKAEALLDEQVQRLASASESLTNALRKPVVRGSWGEMTLENALESAGLEQDIDFVLQDSTDAEDGQLRTDAVINLPKGRKLVIDSKNLMETYIALSGAHDEAQRAALAEAHSKSLRRHIKALSAKEYWRRYEGLDCVILFIPHDGMYHAAIQDESELIREACDRRVFIANPMTLIPLLKAVRYVLDQERLNKNAEEIKEVGGELYSQLARFAGHMSTLGNRLRSTVDAYNSAIPGLDRYIIAKSRRLKQLGIWKGDEAELPEPIEVEPRLFSSKELRASNQLAANGSANIEIALAAEADDEVSSSLA